MAKGFILEFADVGRDVYDAVCRQLGIEPSRPGSDWPAGLKYHAAGAKPGGWVVFEVWDSQDAQERFMRERLGPALAKGGVTQAPSRAEWLELAAFTAPESRR